jgi:uncharacterized membrane protein YjgN (DUF898 family)
MEITIMNHVHKGNVSAVKRAEFVSDRMSYGHCSFHSQTDDDLTIQRTTSMSKEHVFNQFAMYHMIILLWNFYIKAGREHIFKLKTGDESVQKISNASAVRGVNSSISKNVIVKRTVF